MQRFKKKKTASKAGFRCMAAMLPTNLKPDGWGEIMIMMFFPFILLLSLRVATIRTKLNK